MFLCVCVRACLRVCFVSCVYLTFHEILTFSLLEVSCLFREERDITLPKVLAVDYFFVVAYFDSNAPKCCSVLLFCVIISLVLLFSLTLVSCSKVGSDVSKKTTEAGSFSDSVRGF